MQLLGSGRDVEPALGDSGEITQLVQLHPASVAALGTCVDADVAGRVTCL
jgi:hypothetical protein